MRVRTRGFSKAFGLFVQERRAAAGQTQVEFAARLGISSSYVAEMEAGVVPPLERIDAMAVSAGEDAADWLTRASADSPSGGPPMSADTRRLTRLPVRGTVMGDGRIALEEPANEDQIVYLDCSVLQAAMASYIVRVASDSGFPIAARGDIVGVYRSTTARPGDLVVVEGEGDQWLLRYLGRQQGHPQLAFVNPSHPAPPDGLAIIGRATWVVREATTIRRFGR